MIKIEDFLRENAAEIPLIFQKAAITETKRKRPGKATVKLVRNALYNTGSHVVTPFFKDIVRYL